MSDNKERAYITAYKLRQDLRLNDTFVDLNYITKELMIRVRNLDLGNGIEGACKSSGVNRLIVIKPHPDNEVRERFTLSHELGHLLIHHGSHYCENKFFKMQHTQNDIEQEANDFAAELLLPKKIMINILRKNDLSFLTIQTVAKKFKTSLSVAAIRLIHLYEDCAIAIFHDGQQILWQARSQDFYYRISYIMESPITIAAKDQKNNKKYAKGNIDCEYWLDIKKENLVCNEETVYFSKLRHYLTILKIYEDV